MKTLLFSIFLTVFFMASAHADVTLNSEKVIQRTLQKSLKAKSVRLNNLTAKADVKIAKSQYDTTLQGQVDYTKDESQRSNTIFGTESSQTNYNIGLSQLTPLGTQIQVGFNNTKETNNSAFFTNNSFFTSVISASLSQPLLRNSFGWITRKTVSAAKKQQESTRHLTESQLNNVLYQNLNLYWNWYTQSHLVQIHRQALELATKLYITNREKLKLGLIEEADLHAFSANLNLKKSDYLKAKSRLAQSKFNLASALNLNPKSKLRLTKEAKAKSSYPSVENMVITALREHPQLLALKKDLEAHNIQISISKNSKLPQLDLIGSLSSNGIDPTYGTALSNLADINPVWSAGATLRFPLQNRNARHTHKKLKAIGKQKLYNYKDIENQVIADIRYSFQEYKSSLKRLQLTADAAYHQRMKWQGEVRRYNQGRSDPDLVIRYQDDFLGARVIQLQTRLEFALAKTNLALARGAITAQ